MLGADQELDPTARYKPAHYTRKAGGRQTVCAQRAARNQPSFDTWEAKELAFSLRQRYNSATRGAMSVQ